MCVRMCAKHVKLDVRLWSSANKIWQPANFCTFDGSTSASASVSTYRPTSAMLIKASRISRAEFSHSWTARTHTCMRFRFGEFITFARIHAVCACRRDMEEHTAGRGNARRPTVLQPGCDYSECSLACALLGGLRDWGVSLGRLMPAAGC